MQEITERNYRVEITKRNYHLLRKIMMTDPKFGSHYYPNSFDTTVNMKGQVYQHRFHNTVGDKLPMVHINCGSIGLANLPLIYKKKYVVLIDSYSIDLFNYQYGFFFNSGEETFFRDDIKNKYHISESKLDMLRAEGIECIGKWKMGK